MAARADTSGWVDLAAGAGTSGLILAAGTDVWRDRLGHQCWYVERVDLATESICLDGLTWLPELVCLDVSTWVPKPVCLNESTWVPEPIRLDRSTWEPLGLDGMTWLPDLIHLGVYFAAEADMS